MDAGNFNLSDYFECKTVNEWIREAKKRPVPKMLFGDFWLEGELAILFADTGKGKSVLAMQIAESIARGRSIAPMQMNAKPQNVLYLDFELSGKQLELRYAAEHYAEKDEYLKNHYRFSERFKRYELKPSALLRDDSKPYETILRHLIEPLLQQSNAKVLIIDNITYLKRTAESSREAAPLMKELNRLKKELGLSILVLAHTPKRDTSRPITVNDLQGSKLIANFANNIFAVGESKSNPSERYIKHIKPSSTELVYDASHVPTFRLQKINGNFLGFEFLRFATEAEHLRDGRDERSWEIIDQIKEMSGNGKSIRIIAEELSLSKSRTHRLLQMWQPRADEIDNYDGDEYPHRNSSKVHHNGPDSEFPTVTPDGYDMSLRNNYFPGMEEYCYAKQDPRFKILFTEDEPDDAETRFLHRESWVIRYAEIRARKVYKETGTAPRLIDDEEYKEFHKAVLAFQESGGKVIHESIAYLFPREKIEPEAAPEPTPENDPSLIPHIEKDGEFLKRDYNAYNKEIYVESYTDDGKPQLWYERRSNGSITRQERKPFGGVIGFSVDL